MGAVGVVWSVTAFFNIKMSCETFLSISKMSCEIFIYIYKMSCEIFIYIYIYI